MGDMLTAELKEDYERYDMAWLNILHESEELLELPTPDVDKMDRLDLAAVLKANGFAEEEGEDGGESRDKLIAEENADVVAAVHDHHDDVGGEDAGIADGEEPT